MQGSNWISFLFLRNKPIDIWINSYSPHCSALSFYLTSQLPFTAKFLGRIICLLFPSSYLPLSWTLSSQASVPATPVTVTSEHHTTRWSHYSHLSSTLPSAFDALSHFYRVEMLSAPCSRHGILPWFASFLHECSFSVFFLASSSSSQPLNIGNSWDSHLGLFLLCSLTLFHPISWLYILSICCWLQTYNSSPNLSPELQTPYIQVLFNISTKRCDGQLPLKMSQTQPPDPLFGSWDLIYPVAQMKILEMTLVPLFLGNFRFNPLRNPWVLSC